MTDRTCSMPDCDKVYRARGLCATHYNQQHQPNRHRKVAIACAHCGEPVLKFQNGNRNKAYCSWECQQLGRWGRVLLGSELQIHPNPNPRLKLPSAVAHAEPARLFTAGRCVVCREWFVARHTSTITCSDACRTAVERARKRAMKHQRRAVERTAFVGRVINESIYARDGWRCQICKRKVKAAAAVPHPLAPTIDHTTPLSLGGTHEPANVRLACFLCNSTRGNRGGGEQLALIG